MRGWCFKLPLSVQFPLGYLHRDQTWKSPFSCCAFLIDTLQLYHPCWRSENKHERCLFNVFSFSTTIKTNKGTIKEKCQCIGRTLSTLSLALEVFSLRERLRTDLRWWRLAERPSCLPPVTPSLPSLSPDATSEWQLRGKKKLKHTMTSVIQPNVFWIYCTAFSTAK